MRKIFEYIGLLTLMCFSFILTEKTRTIAKNVDSIMIDINNNYEKYKISPKNATIIGNKIIPGICGREVNINKSYNEMKKIGMYDDKLFQYNYYYPEKNIKNNLDKYVVKGNDYKNYIYILINLNEENKVLLKMYEFHNINFIVQYNFYINNKNIINNLIKNDNSIIIENTSFKKLKKISKQYYEKTNNNIYCYNNNDSIEFLNNCSLNKNNSIYRLEQYNSNYLYHIKLNLKKGMLYRFSLNEKLLNEITQIDNYINQKGIYISSVDNNLKEC